MGEVQRLYDGVFSVREAYCKAPVRILPALWSADTRAEGGNARRRKHKMVMTRGESMRKARNRAKLSAAQLSRISGVPISTICALECGTTKNGRIDTIVLLADALRISIDEYIGRRR